MSETDNSFKTLRKYCQELGITAATTGKSIEQLIVEARKADDSRAWLAAIAGAPPAEETSPRETASGGQREPEASKRPDPPLAVSRSTAPPAAHEPKPKPPPPQRPPAEIHAVGISLPISSEEPEGYLEREMHLDVKLDRHASSAFRRLQRALNQNNARLGNGRHVGSSRADVVRWVFERLAASLTEKA